VFAIIDIETTGGFANGNGITEIAIVLHDGQQVERAYSWLVNPGQAIPRYITALTGISDEMVASAPRFEAIAAELFELLKDRVFVAHNVNFDYSFVRQQLQQAGYELPAKKLCTVRLARKILPGHQSYSLGNLCRSLGINIENRHRALGDAQATATLFSLLVKADTEKVLAKMLKGKNADQFLPPHLPAECLLQLPDAPGVYYFENQKKEVIYVGKAISLKKRVRSHFSNNDGSRRKQELMRQVYNIRFTLCYSELMSLILESHEIKRLWPVFNRSQKRFQHKFGLYRYEDNGGFTRLTIEKRRKYLPAIYTFDYMPEGVNYLRKLVPEQQDLQEPVALYNARIEEAIERITQSLPSFVLLEKDPLQPVQWAAYLLEKGKFWGMGYVSKSVELSTNIDYWKQILEASPDNDYIRGLVYQFATKKSILRLDLHS